MPRKNVAVLSVSAQEDNIGDIVIREKLFDFIASTDIDIIGYRGESSDSYMAAFAGYKKCQWFSGMMSLQAALIIRLITGKRLHFFMAPGPASFSSKPGGIAKSFVNLLNMAMVRISGGTVHIIGRAYRGHGLTRITEKAALRLSNSASVRDGLSSKNAGYLPRVLPDLAFLDEPVTGGRRPYLAISVREESDLQDSDFEAFISDARSHGLVPVFVTQVKRDNLWMKRMSARYHADIVEWTDATHHEQRLRVESIYRSSAAILSNRLHGLIMGVMAGAIPIPLVSKGNEKLLPTLGVVFPNIQGLAAGHLSLFEAGELAKTLSSWGECEIGDSLGAANDALKKHFECIRSSIVDDQDLAPRGANY